MKFMALIIVILTSPWFWKITNQSLLLTFLTSIPSFTLCYLLLSKFSKKILILTIIFYLITFLLLIYKNFDESLLSKSALDTQLYNKRHEYLAKDLGKVYTNKFSLLAYKNLYFPLEKLQNNFFSNLDINLYFFASHPRERTGFSEFEKYLYLTIPFFLAGVIFFIKKKLWPILIYILIISLASSFINPKYSLGPILFFPIINLFLTAGITYIYLIFKKYVFKK